MTTTLRLREFRLEPAVPLETAEIDALRRLVPGLRVTPSLGLPGRYDLTPGSTVGAVRTDKLDISIAPKIPLDRVFFMLSYALDAQQWRPVAHYGSAASLVEALVHSYVSSTRSALRRGLLQGYVTVEDTAATVRGRIRFDEQMRRQQALPLPVHVRYDDFTEDTLENRILKAAANALRMLRLRSGTSRRDLKILAAQFDGVSSVRFDPRSVPQPVITRLNAHYAPALNLARAILQNTSLELRDGRITGSAVLFDMNKLFEDFAVTALREALGVGPAALRQAARGHSLNLDARRRVRLEPDLSWWRGTQCLFVGDVKYKRIAAPGVNHPDLYQLLAYTVATHLPAGLLLYAHGEAEEATHHVSAIDKTLLVRTLDLSGTPQEILRQISAVAALIRRLAQDATSFAGLGGTLEATADPRADVHL